MQKSQTNNINQRLIRLGKSLLLSIKAQYLKYYQKQLNGKLSVWDASIYIENTQNIAAKW